MKGALGLNGAPFDGGAVTAAGDALDEVGDIAEGAVDTGGKVLPWNW